MTCDWSMITVDDFTWCEVVVSSVVICLNIFSHAYFWHQKFSFQTLNTEWKIEPTSGNGVNLCRRFLRQMS